MMLLIILIQSEEAGQLLRDMRHRLAEMTAWDASNRQKHDCSPEVHLSVLVTCAQHMDSLIACHEQIITDVYQKLYKY